MATASKCPLKILMFLGSVREGRMCERVAKYICKKLLERGHTVDIADPLKLDIPLLVQALQFYPDPSKAPKAVQDLNEKVKAADAYVILTAEYNRQMPPALTNLLDHCPPASYAYKTSAIVSYTLGPQGATVAAAQCRTLMTELGALPVPFIFSIAAVSSMFNEAGEAQDEGMDSRFQRMIQQLQWYGEALKKHRETVGIPK